MGAHQIGLQRRLVMHLAPADAARGSQAQVRALCDDLNRGNDDHLAVTLFAGPVGALRPDHCLGINDPRTGSIGLAPLAVLALGSFVRRHRPDAIILHGGEVLPYAVGAVPSSIPMAYYRIGTSNEYLAQRRLYRLAYRWMVGRLDATVAISAETAQEAVELFGIDIESVAVVPNSRDPLAFTPPQPLTDGQSRSDVRLAFVGQVSREKGADRFVAAVESLRHNGHAVRGVIAGDGPLWESLSATTDPAAVEFLGSITDVAALLQTVDIFVFPAIDREGMPGVLIEAGMCGVPCVASDLPGVRSVILDGETGFVIGASDDRYLLEQLSQLIGDPALRRRMGQAARRRCAEQFSVEVVSQQWQRVIDRLTSTRS